MKLEVREIAAAMPGPSEPVLDFQATSQERVTALAQRITLRDALSEMHLSDDSGTRPDRGNGAVVHATSTVVTLTAAPVPLPMERTGRRGAR